MSTQESVLHLPWYRSLNRDQWKVLIASNLGWTFDGFEIFALFLTVGFALRQLLDAAQYAAIPQYAGYILACTVFGWATGGVIGGIIADYIGRKRTMMLAILAYSLTTGLSAFAWDWESFAVLRFLVGVAIGSEWATGASIVSELWPDHSRGKGGGLLQCGAGIGGLLASGVWLLIGGTGPSAWRWMYLIGVLPAFVVLWIRRNIPESPRWERADERRRAARDLKRSGAALDSENVALTRFTVVDLFADRTVRRPLIGSLLMMFSVTFAFWGVSTFIPTYVGSIAAKAGLSAPYYAGLAGFITSGCGIVGFIVLGFLADTIGRKPTAMLFYFNVPGADSAGLSVGPESGHRRCAVPGRRLRVLHLGHLGLGAGLAARAVSDSHARDRGRLRLQRAALHLMHRPLDRRHADRRPRRLWHGGDDHRALLRARRRGGAVPAGDPRPALAGSAEPRDFGRKRYRVSRRLSRAIAAAMRVTPAASTECGQRSCGR
jgi:MFS family permease